jgi:peptidoglycan-associated lipoprotein
VKLTLLILLVCLGCDPRHPQPLKNHTPPAPQEEKFIANPKPDIPEKPIVPSANPTPTEETLPPIRPSKSLQTTLEEMNRQLQDAFFAYDAADLAPAALNALNRDAEILKPLLQEFHQVHLKLEGHCDERGSAEYNLALGDQRARRALDVLKNLGVPADRIEVISYGKEAPQCTEETESCWQRNRRAHLAVR